MFLQDPGRHEMEELGFSRHFEVREKITKIETQKPTDFVLYHDLKEMWKRRQSMDLPFVNVGSFVEVKCRSKWDLTRPVTYGGLVIEKEHKDLNAFFIIRKNVASYGENFGALQLIVVQCCENYTNQSSSNLTVTRINIRQRFYFQLIAPLFLF